jgi:hypothetical protein
MRAGGTGDGAGTGPNSRVPGAIPGLNRRGGALFRA